MHDHQTDVPAAADVATPEAPRPDVIVSAVMPTYNMAAYVPAAIDSVVAQSMDAWELIVVDDGSTDATPAVLARYRDPRIRVLRLPVNRGRAAARNAALRVAAGRYIAVCDSDDIFAPDRFARQAAYLDAHPDVDVVSSDVTFFWGDRQSPRPVLFPDSPEEIRRRFARGRMAVAHGASMIRASCFEEHGLYAEELRSVEDFEFFHRIHRRCRFAKLPEILLFYRHALGPVPLRKWMITASWHRYALYLSHLRDRDDSPCQPFERFAGRPDVRVALWSVDILRFLRYHLRVSLQRTPPLPLLPLAGEGEGRKR